MRALAVAVLLLAGCASGQRPAPASPGHLRFVYGDGCRLDLKLPEGYHLVQQGKVDAEIIFAEGQPNVVVRAFGDAAGLPLHDFATRERDKEAALDKSTAEKMGNPALVSAGSLEPRQVAGHDAFEFRERSLVHEQEETSEGEVRITSARVESRQTFYFLDGGTHFSLSFRAPGSDLDGLAARAEPLLHTLTFGPCK